LVAAQVATIDWSHQLSTSKVESASTIARDGSGNVIVGGNSDGILFPSAAGGGFVAKYDPSGGLLWGSQFAGSTVRSVTTDSAGDIFTLGSNSTNGVLRKIGPAGNVLWTASVGPSQTTARGISLDSSGNVFVTGEVDAGILPDALVAKFSSAGSQLWLHQFGTTASDVATGVKVDSSGNAIVIGQTGGILAPTNGSTGDVFARKYDTNGNVVWTRQWGSTQPDIASAVAIEKSGSIFVSGYTTGSIDGVFQDPFGDAHSFVTKLAVDGTTSWTREYNFASQDFNGDVAIDAAGNVYLAGTAEPAADQFLIASLDNGTGNVTWSQKLGSVSDYWLYAIAVDPAGSKLWIGGNTTGSFNGAPSANAEEDAVVAELSVPEPASGLLLVGAVAAAVLFRRQKRQVD